MYLSPQTTHRILPWPIQKVGEIYVCMHPKHTHTHTCSYTSPYQHYHHNSHIHRVSFPNGIFIHVEGPFTIFGVCVYIVCECNVCVNMCVTPCSNLAPYSNHITGHTHALTLTHTHPHTHSHVFAHRMSRPFPSLPPPLSPRRTCLTLCPMYMAP